MSLEDEARELYGPPRRATALETEAMELYGPAVAGPRVRYADGLWDHWEAGSQAGLAGLAWNSGRTNVVRNPDATVLEGAMATAGQMVGDLPVMAVGAVAGLWGGPPAATTGAFVLPAHLRAQMMDYYERRNHPDAKREWTDSAIKIAWETAKGAIVGRATAGVGAYAKAAGAEPLVAGAAELATMTQVGAWLEGHLPGPQEFAEMAIVLGGMKAATGTVAALEAKARDIYARTGVRPAEVMEAAEADPKVWQEMLDPTVRVPAVFEDVRHSAAEAPRVEAEAPRVEAEAPRAAVEAPPPRSTIENLEPLDHPRAMHNLRHFTTEEGRTEMYADALKDAEADVQAARRGSVSHAQSVEAAKNLVTDLLGKDAAAKLPGVGELDARVLAAGRLLAAASHRMSEAANAVTAAKTRGDAPAAEAARAEAIIAREQLHQMLADYLGTAAEIGRGLNAIKAMSETIADVKSIAENLRYRDPNAPKHVKELQDAIEVQEKLLRTLEKKNVTREAAVKVRKVVERRADTIARTAEGAAGLHALIVEAEALVGAAAKVKEAAKKHPHILNLKPAELAKMPAGDKSFADFLQRYGIEMEAPEVQGMTLGQLVNRAEHLAWVPAKIAKKLKPEESGNLAAKDLLVLPNEARSVGEMFRDIAKERDIPPAFRRLRAQAAKLAEQAGDSLRTAAELKESGGENLTAKELAQLPANARSVTELIAKFGGPELDVALATIAGGKTAAEVAALARVPTMFERATGWFSEWYKGAAALSGPTTIEVNLLSNMVYAFTRLPRDVVAATYGKLTRREAVLYREILGEAFGMVLGFREGARMAWQTLRAWNQIDPGLKAEVAAKQIPGTFGAVVRLPFTLLEAGDVWGRAINERASVYAELVKDSIRETRDPTFGEMFSREWYDATAARLRQEAPRTPPRQGEAGKGDPVTRYQEVMQRVEVEAERHLFREKAEGPVEKQIEAALLSFGRVPFAGPIILPFVRTPLRVFKSGVRMTPLAPIYESVRQDIRAGGERADRAIADMLLGTGAILTAWMLVDQGLLTGGGPTDQRERQTWLLTNQPYSFRIGGTWVSYARIEPFATLLGATADAHRAWSHFRANERDDFADALGAMFTRQITEKTFLQSLGTIFGALTEPERRIDKLMRDVIGSVLVPNLLAQTARELDNSRRETYSIIDKVQSRIPVLREYLEPKRDVLGATVPERVGVWPFSSIMVKSIPDDKVRTELVRLRIGTPTLARKLSAAGGVLAKGTEQELTAHERDVMASAAGKFISDKLTEIMHRSDWDDKPRIMKQQIVHAVISTGRQIAQAQVLDSARRRALIDEAKRELQRQLAEDK